MFLASKGSVDRCWSLHRALSGAKLCKTIKWPEACLAPQHQPATLPQLGQGIMHHASRSMQAGISQAWGVNSGQD